MSSAATPALDGLDALARIARELKVAALENEARELARRVHEGRFFVACVGQFKRGKSSLVNALVGAPVLPTGVAPVTSVVTVVRYGDTPEARIALADRDIAVATSDLAQYVSENGNPGNVKNVRAVEVLVPGELLRSGMCIVDTPGIGSVIGANTAATSAFVPKIDAALVVLGADPPISGEELALVAQIAAEVDTLLFVLNKADRFTDAERGEARAFCERVLRERVGRVPGTVFEVSATERLSGYDGRRDWHALVGALQGVATDSPAELVARAATRGTRRIANGLLQEIDERIGALERPVTESEERIRALRSSKSATEQSLRDVHHLMAAEQERLSTRLRARQDAFLRHTMRDAASTLERDVAQRQLWREACRRAAIERAQTLYHDLVERWRVEEQSKAERWYREGIERFVALAHAAVRDTMQALGEQAPSLDSRLDMETGFRTKSQLRYTELLYLTGRSPLRWLLDQVRPAWLARRAIVRDVVHYLRRLLETNASRVISDLDEQARESRDRLEKDVVRRLERVCATAERALTNAREQHARGAAAVADELARLRALRATTMSVLERVGPSDGRP